MRVRGTAREEAGNEAEETDPEVTFIVDPEIKALVEEAARERGISEASMWRRIASKGLADLLEQRWASVGAPPPEPGSDPDGGGGRGEGRGDLPRGEG